MSLNPPRGPGALVAIEGKSRIDAKSASAVASQVRAFGTDDTMVVSSFVSLPARETLRAEGVGYADVTGNIYLAIGEPPMFISDRGSEVDPWRESRPIKSLRGPVAGRVVRALCEFRPPYAIKELARRISTPESSVSRIVSYADREGLVTRSSSGAVLDVDWANLIRAWARDYSVLKTNKAHRYLDPRGLGTLHKRLSTLDMSANEVAEGRCDYAVTGSLAANQIAPYAATSIGMMYVRNVRVAADSLELTQTDRGANIVLLEPYEDTILSNAKPRGVFKKCAPLPQIAADLLTSGGRSPQEAEELLSWMQENEDDWRA